MPVTVELEFFYDCSSPWTYFAFTRIIPMMERLEVPIRWRPILVGGVFNAVNQEVYAAREAMFNDSNSLRLNYYIKDMQDWERLCGVRAQMPPGHPISSVKAMRGVFFAQEQGLLVPYSKAIFETYWGSDTPDISSDEVLCGVCDQVGLDRKGFFKAIETQHTRVSCARTPMSLSLAADMVLPPFLLMVAICTSGMIVWNWFNIDCGDYSKGSSFHGCHGAALRANTAVVNRRIAPGTVRKLRIDGYGNHLNPQRTEFIHALIQSNQLEGANKGIVLAVLLGRFFGNRLFDQSLQFTTFVHLGNDVTTTDQFSRHPKLRESRPVGISGEIRTNFRVGKNIHVGKTFTACL
jgi:2-hydroxychromene-2-carboxylate isomerase